MTGADSSLGDRLVGPAGISEESDRPCRLDPICETSSSVPTPTPGPIRRRSEPGKATFFWGVRNRTLYTDTSYKVGA